MSLKASKHRCAILARAGFWVTVLTWVPSWIPVSIVLLSRPPGSGMEWFCLRHSLLLHFSVTMYDYQAMCKPADHHHSAAESLMSVSVTQAFPLPGHIRTAASGYPGLSLLVLLSPSHGAVGLSCPRGWYWCPNRGVQTLRAHPHPPPSLMRWEMTRHHDK